MGSMEWGRSTRLTQQRQSAGLFYHLGLGKEPTIIIFGENPGQVVEKAPKLIQ